VLTEYNNTIILGNVEKQSTVHGQQTTVHGKELKVKSSKEKGKKSP
jgi:hypothetical protein